MLTDIWVNTAQDIVDGDFASISALIDNPGADGNISLREAVLATNRTSGWDQIKFDSSLDGVPIILSIEGRNEDGGLTGDLDISDGLTIWGTYGEGPDGIAPKTIIDANGIDRIFDVTSNGIPVVFIQSQLTGGRTEGDGLDGSGGAIRLKSVNFVSVGGNIISGNSTSGANAHGGAIFSPVRINLSNNIITENLTTGVGAKGGGVWASSVSVFRTTISGNSTRGAGASGGGIFSEGLVKLTDGIVSGNSTAGAEASGGGIYAGGIVTLVSQFDMSIITENSTTGEGSSGGGIFTGGDVFLAGSTISDNSTKGDLASGGGINALGDVILNSVNVIGSTPFGPGEKIYAGNTLSGNSTAGDLAPGGGIFALGDVSLVGSTISGNSTSGLSSDGGGIQTEGHVSLIGSTVTRNATWGEESNGGGIFTTEGITLTSSIVALNVAYTHSSYGPDLFASGSVAASRSLIGDNRDTSLVEAQSGDGNGNLIGSSTDNGRINPRLGPLADHGGPTLTHGLYPDSPAIDAGSNTNGESFDQRGQPFFDRVSDGFADMGAFEGTIDPPRAALPGDANRDGRFNTDDLLQLLAARTFNTGKWADWEQGDWNADGLFNIDDLLLALAENNFNEGVAATESSTLVTVRTSNAFDTRVIDAVDHYHSQEEALSRNPLEVEPNHIDSKGCNLPESKNPAFF